MKKIFASAIVFLSISILAHAQFPTLFSKISKTSGGLKSQILDGARFGITSASIGDLNDDGVNDIAIGATNQGGFTYGSVFILFMRSDGTVAADVEIKTIESADHDSFGSSICALGDLDGDNIEDIAVGASYDSDGYYQAGALWVLFLNSNGSIKKSQKISALSGNFTGTLGPLSSFGTGLANIGDLDKDGVTDLATGAYREDAVYILFMKKDGTVKSHTKIGKGLLGFNGNVNNGDYFGYGIATVGDLDNDGSNDIAVSAHRADEGNIDQGIIWLLYLTPSGAVKNYTKISALSGGFTATFENIGAISGLGDYDYDGTEDLLMGGSKDSSNGAVWFLLLNSNGSVKSWYEISKQSKNSNIAFELGDVFGRSVSAIGDLDKNGTTDILAGAFMSDDGGVDNGAVWISLPPCQFNSNAGGDVTVCETQKILLNANTPGSASGNWSVLEGSASIVSPQNPQSEVINLSAGVNRFIWILQQKGCTPSTDTVTVQVIARDQPFAGNDITTCANTVGLSAKTPVSGTGSWRMLTENGNLTDRQSATTSATGLNEGLHQVVWEIQSAICPVERDTVNVRIIDRLTAVITPENIFACGDQVPVKAEPVAAGNGRWEIIEGEGEIQDPDSASTAVKIKALPMRLSWTVTLSGCDPAVDDLSIHTPSLTTKDIPNVITPNGDDKNQFWIIEKLKEMPENSVHIYNRWGYPVFETAGYSGNWSGGELSSGTYFYHLNIHGCQSVIKGWLQIIR